MSLISCLPPELLREVLTYLPIPSLLAFGQTSRYNHEIQAIALLKLRVGVFPSRINAIISLFEASEDRKTVQSVHFVLNRKQKRTIDLVIKNQNSKISDIIDKNGQSLQDLEVALWALEEPLAEAIAGLCQLHHLSIRLDHPHSRHPDIRSSYWQVSPPSTVWNSFGGCDGGQAVFGRLRSLKLERAGITNHQLRRIIEQNPHITELRLRRCLNLTLEWFEWLASYGRVAEKLTVLHFTHSDSPQIDNRIIPFISDFPTLTGLSLYQCRNVDKDLLKDMNEKLWRIKDFVSPSSIPSAECVEVDPAYK